jgi:hypothetical protein
MENNKYFTPNIEDLCVGYLCEHTTNMTAFEIDDTDRIHINELSSSELSMYISYCWEEGGCEKLIRTLYLTKEQIEESLVNINILFTFVEDRCILKLYKDKHTYFYGQCKSKNDLKVILGYIKYTI